uniref:Uncharacterized protein n=1 Tax=Salix viminalis TaxID=40686 RepID=A0A6N2N2L7_SALVM
MNLGYILLSIHLPLMFLVLSLNRYDGTRIYSCIEQPRSEDEESDAFDYCSVYDGKFFPSTVSQISCGISSYVVYNPDVISKEPL